MSALSGSTNLAAAAASGPATSVTVSNFPANQTVNGTVTANAGTGTFAVSAAALPLPSGASTASNQTSGAQKTQVVDGSGAVQGPATALGGVNYMPVVLAASATPGSAVVARSIQVAGSDGTNARTITTDTSGNQIININQGTPGTTNNVTLSAVATGNQTTIPVGAWPFGHLRASPEATQLFDDTFATSGALDTTNRWATPVAAGGGVAAAVPVGGGNVTLGTGTTANGYSTLASQASFPQLAPGWIEIYHAINIAFPAPTNTYLFWGVGTIPATPTATAALTDAVGFEIATSGKMFAVCWSGGARNVIQDLSSSGNNTQPGDANVHKYYVFFRGDTAFWCIDSTSNIVATMATGAPGPINNTLPIRLLAIAGATPPVSSVTLNDNAVFIGDTACNNHQISDGTFGWRKATVTAGGAVVGSLGSITGKTNVILSGSLLTSATTANQVVLTHTVTAGKTFYIQSFDMSAILNSTAATQELFGTMTFQIDSVGVYTNTLKGAGSVYLSPVTYSEPISVAAGKVVQMIVTPASAGAFLWNANFGGYEI